MGDASNPPIDTEGSQIRMVWNEPNNLRQNPNSYSAHVGFRLTGFSTPVAGLSWELTKTDKQVAQQVVTFLEDRRLLFGERHMEDELLCYRSAGAIRAYLTDQMQVLKEASPLRHSLGMMRAACRRFMDRGEPGGMGFERRHVYGPDGFGYALGDLRTAIGVQLAAILSQFPMKVEAGLMQILPPEDMEDESPSGWIPGFDEPQGQ